MAKPILNCFWPAAIYRSGCFAANGAYMPPQHAHAQPPARVLVVDDDAAITATLARVLATEHFEVHVANDGASGLAVALRDPPRVVVVDLHMADMNGYQFIDALRDIPECKDVPVMLATASADLGGVRQQIQGRGSVLLAAKPFELDTFVD